jgi:FdhD protein
MKSRPESAARPLTNAPTFRTSSADASDTIEGAGSVPIVRVQDGQVTSRADWLAVEAPVEIRVLSGPPEERRESQVTITMRTPGQDEELAVGFLFCEGLVAHGGDIEGMDRPAEDVVVVHLSPGVAFDAARFERSGFTTSSCGVCGKSALDLIPPARTLTNAGGEARVDPELLQALPDSMRAAQANFERTGGLHAVALFRANGELLYLREDVGRHNALDKLAGRIVQDGVNVQDTLLLLSGRASYELIQKALACRVPVVAAIGAPSSLAVRTAEAGGQTLVGFLKADGFNIYSGAGRIRLVD